LAVAAALTVLSVVYGTYSHKRKLTHSLRMNKAVTHIKDALSDDPNYFVTSSFNNVTNQGLQVCVQKGTLGKPPSWGLTLHKIIKKLPRFLRPNSKRYLYTIKCKCIAITVVEPTEDELRQLKEEVSSLCISRDIYIWFQPFYPDR